MSTVEEIREALMKLSDNDRLECFSGFCKHCGRYDGNGPYCQCWNDE